MNLSVLFRRIAVKSARFIWRILPLPASLRHKIAAVLNRYVRSPEARKKTKARIRLRLRSFYLAHCAATSDKRLLLVSHDCSATGAPFLLLALAQELSQMGFELYILSLQSGLLFENFVATGMIVDASLTETGDIDYFIAGLRTCGTRRAILNTVVTGGLTPMLKENGFDIISLIHELPGVIRILHQEENARLIAAHADRVVFPAAMVYEQYTSIAPVAKNKSFLRPQGVLQQNPYKHDRAVARQILQEKYGVLPEKKIVLGIGTPDRRKGYDLFVDIGIHIARERTDALFVWIGKAEDSSIAADIADRIEKSGTAAHFLFPGFERELLPWFASAEVFALTSREDPFPNVVLQAIEGGTPCVAFDGASGIGDFITTHGGQLARPFDTVDFADKLRLLLDCAERIPSHSAGTMRDYAHDLLALFQT